MFVKLNWYVALSFRGLRDGSKDSFEGFGKVRCFGAVPAPLACLVTLTKLGLLDSLA